jgi:hypothetical protein
MTRILAIIGPIPHITTVATKLFVRWPRVGRHQGLRTSGRRLVALDGLAGAYIPVASLCLATPGLFVHFGSGAVAAKSTISLNHPHSIAYVETLMPILPV